MVLPLGVFCMCTARVPQLFYDSMFSPYVWYSTSWCVVVDILFNIVRIIIINSHIRFGCKLFLILQKQIMTYNLPSAQYSFTTLVKLIVSNFYLPSSRRLMTLTAGTFKKLEPGMLHLQVVEYWVANRKTYTVASMLLPLLV